VTVTSAGTSASAGGVVSVNASDAIAAAGPPTTGSEIRLSLASIAIVAPVVPATELKPV
jgi:hypothetical protein